MDDGSVEEFGPGDTGVIPPGHNAWVVGNDPVVAIDFKLKDYARRAEATKILFALTVFLWRQTLI